MGPYVDTKLKTLKETFIERYTKTFGTFVYSQIVYNILVLIIMKDEGPEVFRLD